jgi:zinc D-Ala-D-Ala dipeptidase
VFLEVIIVAMNIFSHGLQVGDVINPIIVWRQMQLRETPQGFVDLSNMENLRVEILYGTRFNFTGNILPGYLAQGAWMLSEGAEQLQELALEIKKDNLGLHVWDAYRPRRATLAMVIWAENSGKIHLVEEGYIARNSRHNSGAAIDLSIYDLSSGEMLPMGTQWDCFTEDSHIHNTKGIALQNRMYLQSIMSKYGFVGYEKEWWHFELQNASRFPSFDIPYGDMEQIRSI